MLKLIKKNIMTTSFAHSFSKVIFLIQFIFLTRYYGAEGIGRYAFIFSIVTIIGTILNLGTDNLMFRDISKNNKVAKKYYSSALNIKLIIFVIITGSLIPFFNIINLKGTIITSILLGLIIAILDSYIYSVHAVIRAFEKMHIVAGIELFQNIFIVSLVIPITLNHLNFIYVPISFIISKIITAIICLVFAIKEDIHQISANTNFIIPMLKRSYPFLLSGLGILVISRMDIIMLGILKNNFTTGLYELSYSIVRNAEIIPLVITMSFLPKLTQTYNLKKTKQFLDLSKKTLKYVLIFASLILLSLIITGRFIFEKIYNTPYTEISIIFLIIMITSIFIYVLTVTGTILISMSLEKKYLYSLIIGAGINIVLNLLLIPTLDMIGAGIATLVAYIIIILLQANIIKNVFNNLKIETKT